MKNNARYKRLKQLLPSRLSGAAFLMATSAIGPGFITQTTVFTQQLFTSFGFVILLSIIIDLVVQLNIWRIVAVTNMQAPLIANKVYNGLGTLLVVLVTAGGLVFNIGNIGGAGLGMQTLFDIDVKTGAAISCLIAVLIFLNAEFGKTMDAFTKLLGFVMIALTLYTAINSHPPVHQIASHFFFPSTFSFTATLTIVGGTVGGYISFAGAHRMLEASGGKVTPEQSDAAAVQGIIIASVMRLCLFIACAGVIASGVVLPASNPTAAVFKASAGSIGLKLFGLVLWAAAITSVVGAAYTSVSFLQTLHPALLKYRRWLIITFIAFSTFIFLVIGNPVNVLVKAGAINGLILPVSLSVMLIAAGKNKVAGSYKHPLWLRIPGWIIVVLLLFMSVKVLLTV